MQRLLLLVLAVLLVVALPAAGVKEEMVVTEAIQPFIIQTSISLPI